VALAYAWAAFPFTLFALESNSNDTLVAVMVLAAVLAATYRSKLASPARGAFAALAGLTKFAPLALAHEAERLGAAAVQLLAPLRPFAGPPTQSDLLAYFEAVARETSLPITLYLNPGPGADVSIADTIALAKLPRVQLIKESSRDLARVSRLIVEIDRAGHARYFTTMQMLLATLQLGGSGATMPPPGSEIARHVIDAYVAKDYERAAAVQLQFALFPSKWMHRGLAPVMKAAMNLIGLSVGDPYPPYAPLNRDETAALAAYLRTTVLAHRFPVTAAA
jgi:4-hydroxy-tetrahydrodipicolinate synthase